MRGQKIREEVDKCNPFCPMYYSVVALNAFIKGKGKGDFKCPKEFCNLVTNSIDEYGELTCSVSGKKSSKMDGFFEDGKFVSYDTLGDKELDINEIDDALFDEEDSEEVEEEVEVEELAQNTDYEEDEKLTILINDKLKIIENYFITKLGDASYFFTQCREVDLEEKLVTFFNTKNNLISYKSIEKLPKEEKERKMLRAHEYRMPLNIFLSMDIDALKNKLDIFYKSLYDSLKEKEKMSCDGCNWQKQQVQYRAMDCMTCSRNEKCRLPEEKRVDNYS